ncbi:hypothetical protein PFLUV_G00064270 [Perca fluviatilis]|uniref:C-type lectin domain-containing protein n=3 Tax=Perca fluviatilis TaxID=8168 RepID=A0A6A5FK96_PERFL|nr:hypothetical protein PFLUV_G00064270 [Perca fluviatilis]
MERLLLTIIIIIIIAGAGLSAVSSAAGLQYYLFYDRKNFTEAQRYCREKHKDLVTVDSMEVMKILNNTADLDMFYSNNSYRAWTGLYHLPNPWRWSLSDTSFYKPGETEFRQWASGQPDARYSDKTCTGMGPDGLWFNDDCNSRPYTVCADVRGSDVTFVLIKTFMTWPEAQSYCRAHHTDLPSVRNMAENQKVQAVVGLNLVWIGLFRDSWKWSDGSNSSFSFWKNGQPDYNNGNETCVAADFSQSGAWEEWPCDMERAFICYGPVVSNKVMMKVKFENKKNLNLTDPAVMEAMLKQLKQKLRAQGLDDNIKLSWRKQADGKVFHKEDKKTNKRRRKREEL